MSITFNTSPYYDDFDADKNYHKILFKPGLSVQARELTQSQSILQNQIGEIGKFVLAEGSRVSGANYHIDVTARYVDLKLIGNIDSDILNFIGMYAVGVTSDCVGLIFDVDADNLFLLIKPISNLQLNYLAGETLNIFSAREVAIFNTITTLIPDYTAVVNVDTSRTIAGCSGNQYSDILTIPSNFVEVGDILSWAGLNQYISILQILTNSQVKISSLLSETISNKSIIITKNASKSVMHISVDSGVFFTNNHFVKSLPQSIVPNVLSNQPSCVIGFSVNESIVDYIDDSSLLEPAQGSYNYTAPGADRYKISLELISVPFVDGIIQDLNSDRFFEILRIEYGNVVTDSSDYKLGELEKSLAKRTYDQSGNFVVRDFTISYDRTSFFDINSVINFSISNGKAYIYGFEYDQSGIIHKSIDKARLFESVKDYTIPTYYGNHITIQNVTGNVLSVLQSNSEIEFHSANNTSTLSSSTFLGTAYIRNIKNISGSGSSAVYSLYLYNSAISDTSLNLAKSIIKRTTTAYTNLRFSSNILLSTANTASLSDKTFSKLIYNIPVNNVKSIANVSFTMDMFDSKVMASNTFSITVPSNYDFIPTTTLESKNTNYILIASITNGSYNANETINLSDVTMSIASKTCTFSLIAGKTYAGTINIKYTVSVLKATPKTKSLATSWKALSCDSQNFSSLGKADVINFTVVCKRPKGYSISILTFPSGSPYSNTSLVFHNNNIYKSLASNNTDTPGQSSSWMMLENDKDLYDIDTGQRDSFYDHGGIRSKSFEDAGDIIVLFSYYSHSVGGEYFDNSAYYALKYKYDTIPVFVSTDNNIFKLKDCLDFRPRRKNDSPIGTNDSTSLLSSSFSGTNVDFSFYTGRIDKLILTSNKELKWLTGISSYNNFVPPYDVPDSMTLATIQLNPYTGTEKDIQIKYFRHRRYTMDDIANLDTRLSNVEYFTSLNMLEKDIASKNIGDSNLRMKNGFLVDAFKGFGINSEDSMNYFSLDLEEECARPKFSSKSIALFPVTSDGITQDYNLLMFDYEKKPDVSNLFMTPNINLINCNPFLITNYECNLILSPSYDFWVDEVTKPNINIIDNTTDKLNKSTSCSGLIYKDWDTIYSNDSKETKSQLLIDVTNNVIPYARSIPITFYASSVIVKTPLYLYVNGRLVNAWVKPHSNPTGMITGVRIQSGGSNYYSGNTTIKILETASITNATFSFALSGGTYGSITDIYIENRGAGYFGNTTIAITSTTGSGANVFVHTNPQFGSDLISDSSGEVSGVLQLPNNDILRFPKGELHFLLCEQPLYSDISKSKSKATAIFSSSGVSVEVTSTEVKEAPPPPPIEKNILVSSVEVFNTGERKQVYVVLEKAPTSTVTVNFEIYHPGKIKDLATIYGTTSLVFTTTNWMTSQIITITGVNTPLTAVNKFKLKATATSSDTDYSGDVVYSNITVLNTPSSGDTPAYAIKYSLVSGNTTKSNTITTMLVWLSDVPQNYVTVTATITNNTSIVLSSVFKSNSSSKENINYTEFGVGGFLSNRTPFSTPVELYIKGGPLSGNFSVTLTPSNDIGGKYLNNITIPFINTAFTPTPAKAILYSPTTSTSGSRIAVSKISSAIINVKLQAAPSANVIVTANSSDVSVGTIESLQTGTLTFTTANWDSVQTFRVFGAQALNTTIGDGSTDFNVTLTPTSSDAGYSSLPPSSLYYSHNFVVTQPIIYDTLPLVVIKSSSAVITKLNTSFELWVTLSNNPKGTATVPLSVVTISTPYANAATLSSYTIQLNSSNYAAGVKVIVTGGSTISKYKIQGYISQIIRNVGESPVKLTNAIGFIDAINDTNIVFEQTLIVTDNKYWVGANIRTYGTPALTLEEYQYDHWYPKPISITQENSVYKNNKYIFNNVVTSTSYVDQTSFKLNFSFKRNEFWWWEWLYYNPFIYPWITFTVYLDNYTEVDVNNLSCKYHSGKLLPFVYNKATNSIKIKINMYTHKGILTSGVPGYPNSPSTTYPTYKGDIIISGLYFHDVLDESNPNGDQPHNIISVWQYNTKTISKFNVNPFTGDEIAGTRSVLSVSQQNTLIERTYSTEAWAAYANLYNKYPVLKKINVAAPPAGTKSIEVPIEEQNRQLNWIVINRLTPIKQKYDLELVDSIKIELKQSYNKAVNEYNNLLVKFKNSSAIFRQL